ncbi:MAG: hypothetical protein ACQES9_08595 [Myxococcota bacterium]
MKINFFPILACLSMLILSCDFFSGTVYLHDNTYVCNYSSDCPPNNVCIGYHVQWDAKDEQPRLPSVYSGYYGSCVSKDQTNDKMYPCDNGTSDPSDDLCKEYECDNYATPVCPNSLENSCGNGVKDYNEECEYDLINGKNIEDIYTLTFGEGINCGIFFYNLNEQNKAETNYKLFTFSNQNGNLYCNKNCKVNTIHCSSIQNLKNEEEEYLSHLRHASVEDCNDKQTICSGPYAGICLDTEGSFQESFILPVFESIPNYNIVIEQVNENGCINNNSEENLYCTSPNHTTNDGTYTLEYECTDDI